MVLLGHVELNCQWCGSISHVVNGSQYFHHLCKRVLSAWLLHSAVESSATGQNENILIILRLQTEVLEDYIDSLST